MTTPERMKITAPHLASVSDEALTLFIEDAAGEVATLHAPADRVEKLTRYLAIHLATLSSKNIVKEKLEGLEKQYSENKEQGLLSTPYGQEYQRMVDELKPRGKARLNLTVL